MATIVNIADPNAPANEVAVNNLGQIGISNFPSTQSIVGTVSIAQFPSIQAVSGTIDVTDRAARVLGHVIVDSGGSGTNTLPGYTIIQDGTLNTRKLAINADGSLNVLGTISGAVTVSLITTTPTLSSVGASATTVSLLSSNTSRKGVYIFNDSNSAMYVAFAATASTSLYTVKIPAMSFFEMPTTPIYTGTISALWDVATGAARITELA